VNGERKKDRPQGLFVRGSMPLDDTFVSGRVVPQLKHGSLDQMSIGFRIINSQRNDRGIREITQVKLFEISIVTIPANPLASITAMKSFDGFKDFSLSTELSIDDQSEARLKELHADTESDEYKSFFIGDKQFVDIIDGKSVASWQAIVDSAKDQILSQDQDEETIKHIESYYEKADRPSPFRDECGVCDIDMVKSISKIDLEKFLRKGVRFSRDAAKFALCQRKADADGKDHEREADVDGLSEIIENLKQTTASLKG